MSHQQNESRSTAYVFGELSREETTQFERELEQSAELQSEVASIREAVVALEAEFDSQSPGVNTSGREKIEQAMSSATTTSSAQSTSTELNSTEKVLSNRRLFIGLATAASLLVIVGLVFPKLPTSKEEMTKTIALSTNSAPAATETAAVEEAIMDEYMEKGAGEDGGSSASTRRRPIAGKNVYDQTTPQTAAQTKKLGRKVDAYAGGAASHPFAPTDDSLSVVAPSQTDLSTEMSRRASPVAVQVDSKLKMLSGPRADSGKAREAAQQEASAPGNVSLYAAASLADAPAPAAPAGEAPHPAPSAPSATPAPLVAAQQQRQQNVRFKQKRGLTKALDNVSRLSETKEAHDTSGFDINAGQGIGPDQSGDRHDVIEDNPFMDVKNAPLSTFSIDVDTAAYAKVRMYLMQQNSMPRPDAVRIEELINYFTYDYAPPEDHHPFAASMEVAACPWNAKHRLARIGIKGREIEDDRPSSNLVFLLDVSGSMNQPNKHGLVIEGMKMLVDQLTENDSVAIVVYAGAAGLVLDSTTGDQKQTIIESLERLRAGGSTNGGQGITLAYQVARDNFITGGTNRVILCSDGDFNVGVTGTDELVRIAEENAKGNIFLSVLGFGMGNHNDSMMEQISNKGNGNYAFIDSKAEAQKVLVEEMGATLVTIAKDVKIQVEFNPNKVSSYRLIGYANRMLAAQDFNDDTKDAGEIGAGHTVTALYEVVPAGVESDVTVPSVDDLRYQKKSKLTREADSEELLALKLRYKQPEGTESTLIEIPVTDSGKSFTKTDPDFQFAASVASFGMLLRNSPYKGDATYAAVEEIANGGISNDPGGYRSEFLRMVAKAKELSGE